MSYNSRSKTNNLMSNSCNSMKSSTDGKTLKELFVSNVLKTSAMTYAMVMVFAILGGGSLIRLYGESCGLSLFDPSTWLRAIITIGSPWCKALNWVGYMTTSIVEHLWLHTFGLLITALVAYLPGKFTNSDPGIYR